MKHPTTMETDATASHRLKDFKNKGRNTEDLRRRRAEVSVEIRKAKKEEQLIKRRNLDHEEPLEKELSDLAAGNNLYIDAIVANIYSGKANKEFTGTHAARKILSRSVDPPVDVLINLGIVPKLVEFLRRENDPDLQYEAAWAITNIVSGTSEQTKAVVNAGAVGGLIALLGSPHSNIVDQAVWALGNIAGDGPELRDHVTRLGIVEPLLNLIRTETPTGLSRNISWAICNLCRYRKPRLSVDAVLRLLPALVHIVHCQSDAKVLSNACWALCYVADGPEGRIQDVVDSGVVPRLVALLEHPEVAVVSAALRCVGNIVAGNDSQTDCVLAAGVCPILAELLEHSESNVVKEAAWTVSNVAAGSVSQIQILITNNVIQPLIQVLDKGSYKCQKEAAWAITNIAIGGKVEQIAILCQMGVIGPMCNLLDLTKDAKTILVALDGLAKILAAAVKAGQLHMVSLQVEQCDGLDRIENLQNHENDEIYRKALGIIEAYFSGEDDEDSELVPSSTSHCGNYEFNQQSFQAPEGGFSF